MDEPLLKAKGIVKRFPGVLALDGVNLDLYRGEVHIIVGENGAGKSTLAKCLLGAYIPDAGEIFLSGNQVKFRNSKDALGMGISAVYQEFNLIPYLNVAQNIFFSREFMSKIPGIVDSKKMHEEAKKILHSFSVDYIDTKNKVKHLGVAEQQMVEIAKTISRKPQILILDEPTAPLSEREVEALFNKIHTLKKNGLAIVYVSHRMQEFDQIGDRITVLRDGRYIDTVKVGEISNDELVKMMVGRDISQVYSRQINTITEEALRVEGACDRNGKVKDVSIKVGKGEIVGLAGLVGAGRTELAKLIFGIDKMTKGSVFVYQKKVNPKSPVTMMKSGVGLLPENRKAQGLAIDLSVSWNILAVSLSLFFPRLFINGKKVRKESAKLAKEQRVITPSVNQIIKYLSGGNQQKVVVAKWLSTNCDIIIFDEPTRGIDVGAKMEIYKLLDSLAAEGKAILMISSELPEIVGLSDRIYVLHEGQVSMEYRRGEMTEEQIAAKMLGVEV